MNAPEEVRQRLKNTLKTPELIAGQAFGGSDIFKVQSQHERLLREINNLSTEEEKLEEIVNAVKYLAQYKSYYWLELANLIDFLMSKDETKAITRFKILAPGLTKTDFCKKYLGLAYPTVQAYLKIIRNYKDYGFTEEQLRVLGFGNSAEIIKTSRTLEVWDYSKKTLEELKKLTREEIRGHIKNQHISGFERLKYDWRRATQTDKEQFKRFINEEERPAP